MTLSVAIITLNEEINLGRTLESVKDFADEIVIVDSGSTDKTEEIAKKYKAKFYYQKWLGFGAQRNMAIDYSTSDWVLNIDADEEISPKLKEKIIEIKNNPKSDREIFELNFMSVCFGLFKKNAGRFDNKNVHEEFQPKSKVYRINEYIYHHTYSTVQQYLDKINKYTTLGAIDYYRKNKKSNILQIIFNPIYKFLMMYIFRLGFLDGVEYIFRLGFLDGIEGFLLAMAISFSTMIKYYKLREIYKNKSYIENGVGKNGN